MPKSYISTALPSIHEAQAEFSQALGAGKVLLIDSTLGGVAKQVQIGVEKVPQQTTNKDVLDYIHDLKALSVPQTSQDIYALFFGQTLPWQTHSIESPDMPDLTSTALIILSGSPANVTDGVQSDEEEVIDGLTHRTVLERESAIIRQAFERNIPVLGICYGHQIINHVLGGVVSKLNGPICGTSQPQLTQQGSEFMAKINFDLQSFQSPVPAYHQDVVSVVPPDSLAVFEAQTQFGLLNYGTVHKRLALSVQYHPEYVFIEPLLTALRDNQTIQLPRSISSSVDSLRLFSLFLNNRKD